MSTPRLATFKMTSELLTAFPTSTGLMSMSMVRYASTSTGTSFLLTNFIIMGQKQFNKKIKLDLVGLDGNAYSLMGAFQKQARREGWSAEEIKSVLDEAKSGDYAHLVTTLARISQMPRLSTDPLR